VASLPYIKGYDIAWDEFVQRWVSKELAEKLITIPGLELNDNLFPDVRVLPPLPGTGAE